MKWWGENSNLMKTETYSRISKYEHFVLSGHMMQSSKYCKPAYANRNIRRAPIAIDSRGYPVVVSTLQLH